MDSVVETITTTVIETVTETIEVNQAPGMDLDAMMNGINADTVDKTLLENKDEDAGEEGEEK